MSVLRALALVLVVFSPAALAQQAEPLIPEAVAEETREAINAVKALDPPGISRMPTQQALGLVRRVRMAQLEITHILGRALQGQMSEERFKTELAARNLGELLSEDFQRRMAPLEGKLSPEEKRQLDRELGERYPAYGNYVKRALFAGVFVELLPLRPAIDQQYITTTRMPAEIEASRLKALRGKPGVQSASYSNGVFRVVLDRDIVDGGVFEYRASPKPDGTLEWRCTSSENARPFAPTSCRQ